MSRRNEWLEGIALVAYYGLALALVLWVAVSCGGLL